MSSNAAGQPPPSLAAEILVGGLSVCAALLSTYPLDVVKTRLQLQERNHLDGASMRPHGMLQTGLAISRHEGPLALWRGLTPGLTRAFLYGGLRLGLYAPIKSGYAAWASPAPVDRAPVGPEGPSCRGTLPTSTCSPGQPSGPALQQQQQQQQQQPQDASLLGKLLAGSLSGALASAVTNPTELLKTRMQARGSIGSSASDVARGVMDKGGVTGFWRGVLPAMSRAALITACQCAAYDECKRLLLLRCGWEDSLRTHLSSSLLAGLVATTAANPLDVVKSMVFVHGTRTMGPAAAAARILRTDGPRGFLRGWAVSFTCLGPQTVVTFVTSELLRKHVLGMRSV